MPLVLAQPILDVETLSCFSAADDAPPPIGLHRVSTLKTQYNHRPLRGRIVFHSVASHVAAHPHDVRGPR